jgi:hypothetical protein
MQAYLNPIHRAAIGVAALAATALVVGVSVVAPASVDPAVLAARMPATAAPSAAEGPVALQRIEVVAERDTNLVSVHGQEVPARHKQQI